MSEFSFTPPGALDVSWDSVPPRGSCCPLIGFVETASVVWYRPYLIAWWDDGTPAAPAWTGGFRTLAEGTVPSSLWSQPEGDLDDPSSEDHAIGNADGNDGFSADPAVDGTGAMNLDYAGLTSAGFAGGPPGGIASNFQTVASDYKYIDNDYVPHTPGPEYFPSDDYTRSSIRFGIDLRISNPSPPPFELVRGTWRAMDGPGIRVTYTLLRTQWIKTPSIRDGSSGGNNVIHPPTWERGDDTTETHTITIPIPPGPVGVVRGDWIEITAAPGEVVAVPEFVVTADQTCVGD